MDVYSRANGRGRIHSFNSRVKIAGDWQASEHGRSAAFGMIEAIPSKASTCWITQGRALGVAVYASAIPGGSCTLGIDTVGFPWIVHYTAA